MAPTKKTTQKVIDENARLEWEPVPFKAFGKTTRINSRDLAVLIRQHFQKTFHDCKGCLISYTDRFQVTLFFENNATPVEEGKIKNLVNLTTGQGVDSNDLFGQIQVLNRRYSGRTYELNEETKLLLSDFMYGGRKANNPKDKNKWNNYVTERRVPASNAIWQPNSESIIIAVTGLDIRVICQNLFGRKMVTETITKDGEVTNVTSDAFYEVRYSKAMPDTTFMINIEQFDKDAVEELNKKENPQMIQNYGLMMF